MLERLHRGVAGDELLASVGRDPPLERCPHAHVDRRRVLRESGERARRVNHTRRARCAGEDRAPDLRKGLPKANLVDDVRVAGRDRKAERQRLKTAADTLDDIVVERQRRVQLSGAEHQRMPIEERDAGRVGELGGDPFACRSFL